MNNVYLVCKTCKKAIYVGHGDWGVNVPNFPDCVRGFLQDHYGDEHDISYGTDNAFRENIAPAGSYHPRYGPPETPGIELVE